jgi:retron-type reverse transcriptase
MKRNYPDLLWCRYADDGLVHCRSEQEAEALKAALQARLAECQLELHPGKTRIVYCKDINRNAEYPNVSFGLPRILLSAPSGQKYPEPAIVLWV